MPHPIDLLPFFTQTKIKDIAKDLEIPRYSVISAEERFVEVKKEFKKRSWADFTGEWLIFFAKSLDLPSYGSKSDLSSRLEDYIQERRKAEKKAAKIKANK